MPRLQILKPRVATIPGRLQTVTPGSWRTSGMTAADRGYGYAWQKARERFLRQHPLCVMCEQERPPRVTAATVVDHKVPHRGDQAVFWDETNWQSLCKPHHDGEKQRQENEATKA